MTGLAIRRRPVTVPQTGTVDGVWARLVRRRGAMAGAITLALIAITTIVGPWLSPHGLDDVFWDRIEMPPDIGAGFYFGTDDNGRDLFVRTLFGGRISLLVGLAAASVSMIIGTLYGATAGLIGGRVDALMMRIVDILYALPFMFFVILLAVFFGRSLILIFVAIGAVEWLDTARITRGQAMALVRRDFVTAARSYGAGRATILFQHILPHLLGPVVVFATLTVPRVILLESFLSFLGLGVQEPMTSWGALIADGARLVESAPWMLLFPGGFLAATLFAFNALGDGVREALDPRGTER
jgi:oligopeptide transport system permease protein